MAWNQVKLRNVEEKERDALEQEVKTLRMLKHHNIIRFFDSWTKESDKDKSASLTINFITELCNHTLRKCALRRAARAVALAAGRPAEGLTAPLARPAATPRCTRRWTCAPSRTGASRF